MKTKSLFFCLMFIIMGMGFCFISTDYQAWNPNMAGFSNVPTLASARYTSDGHTMHCTVVMNVDGVSNANNLSVSLPLNAARNSQQKDVVIITNNGTNAFGRLITRPGSNIIDLCPSATGGTSAWTTTGTKSFTFNIVMEIDTLNQRIIFDGNSLMRRGGGVVNQNGVSYGVYNSLLDSGYVLTHQNYAVGGRTTTQLISEWGTKIKPYISSGDLVILWEITNDVAAGANATTAYNNIKQYCDSVHAVGASVVVLTAMPRNDVAAYWPIIDSTNTMMRTTSPNADMVINLNSMGQFDAAVDANNTTYFLTDKVHLTSAAETLVNNYTIPLLISSGLLH